MLFHLKFVAFTFVVPLLLINAFVKKVYGLSLGQVCINIISRYSEVDKLFGMDGYYWTVILMTLIFSWMLLIPFGSFLDGIYLQILGKRQQLIYVGEKEEGSQYVTKENSNTVITGPGIKNANNLDSIYNISTFLRDPINNAWAGKSASSSTLLSQLWMLVFAMSWFLTFALAIVQLYVHPIYDLTTAGQNMPAAIDVLNGLTQKVNVDHKNFTGVALIAFLLITFFSIVSGFGVSAKPEKRYIPLPDIKNRTLTALPFASEQIWEDIEIADGAQRRWRRHATSRYAIYFRLEDIFRIPVYLYDIIDSNTESDLFGEVQKNIGRSKKMLVSFNEEGYLVVER